MAPALQGFLTRHRRVGLDTSLFIYHLESHPKYGRVAADVFSWIQQRHAAVTSVLTMLELLVHPYRAGDHDRVNDFYALLTTFPGLTWMDVNLAIADAAAQMRTAYNLRSPDALQIATAVASHATGFLTNHKAFRRVKELEILLLDDCLSH